MWQSCNWRLLHCVFRSHHCRVQSTGHITEVPLMAGLICTCKRIRYLRIYEACISPALNKSSAVRHFGRHDAIEICDGIIFDFYMRLPHIASSKTSRKYLLPHMILETICALGWFWVWDQDYLDSTGWQGLFTC